MEKKSPAEQQHKVPKTLLEAVRYFADEDVAHSFAASLRWPDGPECPRCECKEYSFISTRKLWKCKNRDCRYQYSVKKGTIFEDSPLGFDKWLPAVWLAVNCKNGVSSHELARALGVHQESAWHMLGRIRLALEVGSFDKKLAGEIEADESYVGGKSKFMHKSVRARRIHGTGPKDKTAVMGIMERGGEIRTKVLPDTKKRTLQNVVREHVEPGSDLYTDANYGYVGLVEEFGHEVVDHAVEYVRGKIHTNSLENFWSLLKRSLRGTYVSVEPEHLHRYVAEQVFRFNQRHGDDGSRFASALDKVEGKRLTYRDLKKNA